MCSSDLFPSHDKFPRFVIEDGELHRQCGIAMVDQNARVAGTLLKDRARYKLDMCDSMRYFLQTYFLEFARRSYFRGVASGVLSV